MIHSYFHIYLSALVMYSIWLLALRDRETDLETELGAEIASRTVGHLFAPAFQLLSSILDLAIGATRCTLELNQGDTRYRNGSGQRCPGSRRVKRRLFG